MRGQRPTDGSNRPRGSVAVAARCCRRGTRGTSWQYWKRITTSTGQEKTEIQGQLPGGLPMWNIGNVYKYRDDNLKRLGFKNFRAYLRGELWRSIERRVFDHSPTCRCCGDRRAERVHHRAFDPATLTGESIAALTALCERCFRWSKRTADANALAEQLGRPTFPMPNAPLFAPFRGSALPRRRRLRKAPRPALTTIAAPRLRRRQHGGGEG